MKKSFYLVVSTYLASIAIGMTAPGALAAEPYPFKPIRIIVPAQPGGALDITTRLVAQKMSEKLGQSVIVDNRSGGDTLVGTRLVKAAPADGYTLLAQANGFSTLPSMKLDPGYDPLKDFTGIGFMIRSPLIMEVGAGEPDRTVTDFINRAKAHPNQLSYGHAGTGSPIHIASEMFLRSQALQVTDVPYKGNGAALPDVIGGRSAMIFDGYISSAAFIQSGKLRPLAVTSSKRIAPLADVPTFIELGMDFNYTLWLGLVARTGTPKDVIQRLSEALHFATASRELNIRFRNEGSDPSFVTPDEFNAYLTNEVTNMSKLIGDLKLLKQ